MYRREKAIVGRTQFHALTSRAIEIVESNGREQLKSNMIVINIKLIARLYGETDRIIGKITINDVYRAVLRDSRDVRENGIRVGDTLIRGTETLKLHDEEQEFVENTYKRSFEYATKVLEGRQVNHFLKYSKDLAKMQKNKHLFEIAQMAAGVAIPNREQKIFLEPQQIRGSVERFRYPKTREVDREETREMLLEAYEYAKHKDHKNLRDKINDKLALFWSTLLSRKPKKVEYVIEVDREQ